MPVKLAQNQLRLTRWGTALALLFTCAGYSQIKYTSGESRLKVKEQRQYLASQSIINHVAFSNIGPSIMSGRVVDLEVNPDDPKEFYVAYASGGLWYTQNNGQSFTPIFDSADILTLGDIAVNWNKKIIWAGTGEVNSSRSSYAGMGLYKSADQGRSWQYLGLPESHHIGKILLHPSDENTAWVAVLGHLYSANPERGIYKTTDGGKTWKQTLFIDANTGGIDLDLNPVNPDELYASVWYRTRTAWNFEECGSTSGIYKSADGGTTWQLASTPGSGFPTGKYIGRIGLAVYPKNPGIIYAVVDNQEPKPDTTKAKLTDTVYQLSDFRSLTLEKFAALDDKKLEKFLRKNYFPKKYTAARVKELVSKQQVKPTAVFDYLNVNDGFSNTGIYGCQVYRSDDAGKTWRKTHNVDIGIYSTYGYYFGKIYVSPYNENKVFIFGVPLQLSTDGGQSFQKIDKKNVHGDHHVLWINPHDDAHLINGNDGGVNISYDNGAHWAKCNTPSVGQYYSVTTDDAQPYNVYGGLQDNNVWYGPSDHQENVSWHETGDYAYKSLVGGDGMQVQVDTRDNTTTYAGSQFGYYVRMNRLTRDDGVSVRPYHELGEPPLRFNWETPILLSRHNQDIFYIGSNKFHRSLNKGDSLVALSGDLTEGKKEGDVPYGTLTTISESPLRMGLLYAGTDDGNIHVSKDGGYSWTRISNSLPAGLWVSHLTASQYQEGRIYACLNGYRFDHFLPYVYVSEDYGEHWKSIVQELPFEPVNVIREDPRREEILYVGTDGGVYVSLDRGVHFMSWNQGLPRSVPVHDIAIQQRENELLLGTHGRSLYKAKLDSLQLLLTQTNFRKEKEQSTKASSSPAASLPSVQQLFSREGLEVKMRSAKPQKKAANIR